MFFFTLFLSSSNNTPMVVTDLDMLDFLDTVELGDEGGV